MRRLKGVSLGYVIVKLMTGSPNYASDTVVSMVYKVALSPNNLSRSLHSAGAGYCDSLSAYAAATADSTLPRRLGEFLEEQLCSRFLRFCGISELIDGTYDRAMKPFIRSLP